MKLYNLLGQAFDAGVTFEHWKNQSNLSYETWYAENKEVVQKLFDEIYILGFKAGIESMEGEISDIKRDTFNKGFQEGKQSK